MRRVYTDDSDLFLCALHAGWVSWSATRQARREGKDLRLELRLTKEPRYVGGLGARYVGTPEGQDGLGDDDGSSLLSAGWGNSHDGSGMEILNAEFVEVRIPRIQLKTGSDSFCLFDRRALLANSVCPTGASVSRSTLNARPNLAVCPLHENEDASMQCPTRITKTSL